MPDRVAAPLLSMSIASDLRLIYNVRDVSSYIFLWQKWLPEPVFLHWLCVANIDFI